MENLNLNIERFDPTKQQLNELVERAQTLKDIDIDDSNQLEQVKKVRIDLKNARVGITKTGKEMRNDAIKFQRAVIEKEKELVGIIEPEEKRLKGIEEEAKQKALLIEREKLLPWRKEKLTEVDAELSDGELLNMDDKEFQLFLNEKAAEKLAKQEEEKRAKEAEEQRKKELAEAEERARKEAEEKAKKEAEEAEKRHQEELERLRREKEQEEEQKRQREKRREKEKKYQEWLKQNGYTEENKDQFYIVDHGHVVELYKLVDSYYPEN